MRRGPLCAWAAAARGGGVPDGEALSARAECAGSSSRFRVDEASCTSGWRTRPAATRPRRAGHRSPRPAGHSTSRSMPRQCPSRRVRRRRWASTTRVRRSATKESVTPESVVHAEEITEVVGEVSASDCRCPHRPQREIFSYSGISDLRPENCALRDQRTACRTPPGTSGRGVAINDSSPSSLRRPRHGRARTSLRAGCRSPAPPAR